MNLALNHLVYLDGHVVPVSAALPSAFGRTFWILFAAQPAVDDPCSWTINRPPPPPLELYHYHILICYTTNIWFALKYNLLGFF